MAHTNIHDGYKVTFWKGGIAAKDDEDWDSVVVSTLGAFPTEMRFQRDQPEQLTTYGLLLTFLDKAYAAGYAGAKSELRTWLGASGRLGQ